MLRPSSSLATLFALTLAACDPGSDPIVKGPAQDISEVGEDCAGCLRDLAECSSTAKTEQQFVECRDLFQACQNDRDLAFETCGSPSKQLACGLCQDRLAGCEEEGGDDCETEFATCRQLLIRSSAFTCEAEDEPEAEASCDDCQRELAACASGGDEASVCQNGFAACRDLAGLGDACANPTDAQACELCDAQTETCNAQSDEATCTEGRATCVAQLASSPEACPLPDTSGEGGGTGEGGGGEGGGGEGGATGEGGGGDPNTTTSGGGTCEHDACVEGDSPEATCNACTTEVCESDAFCCDGAWDATCVGEAAAVEACGCTATTCAHDVCETGEALEQSCNECATTVCAQDDYCCTTAWDTTCTELAAQSCGCAV